MSLSAIKDIPFEPRAARKSRGAFFTPAALACFVSDWAIRTSDDAILEPSCGEGDFLLAAAERLESLGASAQLKAHLTGYEVHAASIRIAKERLAQRGLEATITRRDFLAHAPKKRFDAIIGNPPYVRYQAISASQRQSIRSIADQSNVSICALASLWMPFVIQSALHLRPGGRLGFVLPAELLTVNYAAALRTFLLSSFSSVRLVTFEERVFPDVQEEVVLLLADGWQKGSSSTIAWQPCTNMEDLQATRLVSFQPPEQSGRWSGMFAGNTSLQALASLASTHAFVELEQWGTVSLGAVTGKNDYFVLSQAEAKRWQLTERDVIPVSPPGSKHLRRLAYTTADHERNGEERRKTLLFHPRTPLSPAAKRYIEHGEAQGVHRAYKCRVRQPWWQVPIGCAPDAFFTYMNAYGPSICANDAGVLSLNSCHGICFDDALDRALCALLPIACLNSATMLSAEVSGRSYGGGILKLEPREAARLAVPAPDVVRQCATSLLRIKDAVEELLHLRDFDAAVALVDEVLLSEGCIPEAELASMRSSATLMRARRKTRAKAATPKAVTSA